MGRKMDVKKLSQMTGHEIVRHPRSGFLVRFNGRGRQYHYRCRSVIELAERLGVVPEKPDVYSEAMRCLVAIESGEACITVVPVMDTLRAITEEMGAGVWFTSEETRDEWGRMAWRLSPAEKPEWLRFKS